MLKIIILVLSYNDEGIYSKFFEKQRKTWDAFHVDGVQTFYFFGNHHKSEIIDNTILLDVKETTIIKSDKNLTATNFGLKTLKAFELIENMDFDYIFRTNSSSYIDKKLLIDHIEGKSKKAHYSGFIGKHRQGFFKKSITFASGSGFFLSKDLVRLLIANKAKWNHSLIDDVLIGSLLKEFNILPQSNPRFDVITSKIPLNYFHYRFKTQNRELDCDLMEFLFIQKKEYYKNIKG